MKTGKSKIRKLATEREVAGVRGELKKLQRVTGWSARKIAKRAGMPVRTVIQVMNDETKILRATTYIKIASFLYRRSTRELLKGFSKRKHKAIVKYGRPKGKKDSSKRRSKTGIVTSPNIVKKPILKKVIRQPAVIKSRLLADFEPKRPQISDDEMSADLKEANVDARAAGFTKKVTRANLYTWLMEGYVA